MAAPREEPYVWVTWISKLMAGEASCEWAAWFRAHHTYERLPSDFDVAQWTAEHTAMVRKRAEALQAEGWRVQLEAQNAFRLRGSEGTTLAGKPDLVALRGGETVVVDCKTGNPKTSDQMQVLIYMVALPHAHPSCRGRRLDGEVCYRNDAVRIGHDRLTAEFRRLFRETVHRVGGRTTLPRAPSWPECRYCDIGSADCPQRVETPPAETPVEHDLF